MAPDDLPGHIRVIWDEMARELSPAVGVVGLEAFCVAVHRLRTADEAISREGIVVADAKGNPVPHPALGVEKQAQAEVRAWLSRWRAA
ncbi:MAG: P27 family phage terminase small subunit [Geminicoccaceae bacterium]